jgi:transcriptional regulator with XRE-family HTH domain
VTGEDPRPAQIVCPYCGGSGRVPAETLGQRIRAIRQTRGMSTAKVVELTGNRISQGNLNHLESGRHRNIRIEVLEAIADALKADAGYLLTGKGVP